MADLLGDDGTKGTVGAELAKIKEALTGNGGIKSIVDGVAGGTTAATLDISAKFTDLENAVKKATGAIDAKLDSGDLTQLDTSNLKALRSSINDIQTQLENTFTDLGLKFNANNNNPNVPLDKLKKLQETLDSGVFKSNTELGEKAGGVVTSSQNQAERATSSKAAIDDLLKAGGTLGAELTKITDALNPGNTNSLAGKIDKAATNADLDFSNEYTAFKGAVEKSVQLIDKALESNDLTELDTTNLKALRSYINETKATFDAALKESGVKADGANQANTLTDEKIDKLKAGLKPSEELAKTATEKATATHTFSQQQPETVADMRTQLKTFAADPKGADLASANFTSYLETVDAALSNISDQRAKLGASQNETATSSKAAMEELLGDDGATGDLKTQFDKITAALTDNTTGIQKLVETAVTAAGTPGKAPLDVTAAVTALKGAVTKANELIDEKLESGDLTQLDTSNLKALRSSINDIQSQLESAFTDLGLKAGANTDVSLDNLKKLKETLDSGVVASNTELGEKAKGVATSSQNQAEIMLRVFYRLKNTNSIILRHITILVVSFVCGFKNTNSIKLN